MTVEHDSKLAGRTVPSDIALQVEERIRGGEFQGGDYLIEGTLRQQYAVARSSIRSALQELHLKGMVDAVQGKGWRVRSILQIDDAPQSRNHETGAPGSFADDPIVELLELRMSIEPTAAGLAAFRAKESEIRHLERLSAAYQRIKVEDVEALLSSDENFHRALIRAAHNDVLLTVYETQVVEKIRDYRRRSYTDDNPKVKSDKDHELIVEAVRRRDPQLARRTTLLHLWTLYDEVRKSDATRRRQAKGTITIFG